MATKFLCLIVIVAILAVIFPSAPLPTEHQIRPISLTAALPNNDNGLDKKVEREDK